MASGCQVTRTLTEIVQAASIKGLEGKAAEDGNFRISGNFGYGGYGAVKQTSHMIDILCTRRTIPANVEFALKLFRCFLSNPHKQYYFFTKQIENLALDEKYNTAEYAKEHKELPPRKGLMGPKIYNMQADILAEEYGINIQKVTLIGYEKANKLKAMRKKKLALAL